MKAPLFLTALATAVLLSGCSDKEAAVNQAQDISADALTQIRQLGFSAENVQRDEDGNYVVEGDILLSPADLSNQAAVQLLRVGQDEQYRTTNTVSGTRTITISVSSQLPSAYITAIDEVVRRFNAENLRITFSRVSAGGNISIVRASGSYLASAGFPTSAGEPFNQVKVNSRSIGTANPTTYIATILAHEIGHCIGFRHTDYMDRSYSCGGATSNEGASTVGAVLIPGTPSAADPNSWMLACIGSGQNRPFNANDRTALGYIY
ncbi:M57 family metalloprotease [Hymenobacter canadensis]|uniref:M57 family metalloprotease n=1 Tax=Hymenobacter canadensis TaxID=2999067 RepID=A0ABY7LIT2_9BACT|nr:M57 family metalloprotease [Hymenobacter canadensis]WBA40273.1 M57 family metalloprotease [Hymenobacter canadensis]